MRQIAAEAGLATAHKKDSTGICFIGERNFREFLSRYLPAQPGEMRTPEGELKGRHHGLMYYTLGQRQGLGIGGSGNGKPWFVADKDLAEQRAVSSCRAKTIPLLYSVSLVAGDVNWIDGRDRNRPVDPLHRQVPLSPAGPGRRGHRLDADRWLVEFDEPQKAVTPGQAVVFYDGDECLGGGTIDAVNRE